MTTTPEFLTLAAVADKYGVAYVTVWRKVQAGTLPATLIDRKMHVLAADAQDVSWPNRMPVAMQRSGQSE